MKFFNYSKIKGKIPQANGIYIIRLMNKKVYYIGMAYRKGGIKERLKKHLSQSKKPSSFRKHVLNYSKKIKKEDTKKWIIKNCMFSFVTLNGKKLERKIYEKFEESLIKYFEDKECELFNIKGITNIKEIKK